MGVATQALPIAEILKGVPMLSKQVREHFGTLANDILHPDVSDRVVALVRQSREIHPRTSAERRLQIGVAVFTAAIREAHVAQTGMDPDAYYLGHRLFTEAAEMRAADGNHRNAAAFDTVARNPGSLALVL